MPLMSLRKFTSLQVLSVEILDPSSNFGKGLSKVATFSKESHRAVFNYQIREGYIYVRSRAISSRVNDNFDGFDANEIKKAYKTFLFKPAFINHHNDDHRKARGVIIDAALHEDYNKDGSPDTWVELLHELDAVKYPKFCQAIVAGHINKTSMGTDVEYSICSACSNKATTPSEYCKHIPQLKGSKLIRRNASTGRPEESLVFEQCYGLSFFENSFLVEEPADATAWVIGEVDDRGLHMHAGLGNFIASVKPKSNLAKFVATKPIATHQSNLQGFIASADFLDNPTFGGKDFYHGTTHKFDQFSNDPPNRNNSDQEYNTGLGTHLASHPAVTRHFTKGSNDGRVIRAHLAINKPKIYKSEAAMGDHALEIAKKNGIENCDLKHYAMLPDARAHEVNDFIAEHPKRKEITEGFKKHLESKGHDGIIYHNDIEDPPTPAAIAFHPHQIHIQDHNWNPGAEESKKYFGSKNNVCSKCNGKGNIWHEGECNKCDGTGKLNKESNLARFAMSGDGYVYMPDGSSRWGIHGAAGILMRHKGEDGEHKYMLQKRSGDVDESGTWSTPGGALHLNEKNKPLVGARRELKEEHGIDLPKGHKVIKQHIEKEPGWSYTTSLVHVPHRPEIGKGDGEGDRTGWFTHKEMGNLNLHPGLKKALPHLIGEK